MWILLSLLLPFLSVIALLHARSHWKGTPCESPDGAYEKAVILTEKPLLGKAQVRQMVIGVRAAPTFRFTLRSETAYDRFAKRTGLIAEHQTSDASFDRTIYIESDDTALAKTLDEDSDLRTMILRAFTIGAARGYLVESIVCRNGRVWCVIKPKVDLADLSSRAEAVLVPMLHRLAASLHAHAASRGRLRDRFLPRVTALVWISRITAAFSVLYAVWAVNGRDLLLYPLDLFIASAPYGLWLFAAFVIVALIVLRRSSRAHFALIEIVLFGGVGIVLGTYALASIANMVLDTAAPEVFVAHDAKTHQWTSRGRRGGTSYQLHIQDWRGRPHNWNSIEIDEDSYNRLPQRGNVLVMIKPGALGYAWIARVAPAAAN